MNYEHRLKQMVMEAGKQSDSCQLVSLTGLEYCFRASDVRVVVVSTPDARLAWIERDKLFTALNSPSVLPWEE